ncbi:MAG: SUMF1/EgtB/PvdO family nonheme iron enzyme [Chitinophagaceae bacterium]|nr:SUMF1/EgtB/PvdO family nonheme iron enzyme [Chitinophagaceae bacterium]
MEREFDASVLKNSATILEVNRECTCNFGAMTDRDGSTMKGFKDDGYFYTAPIKSFSPGPNGLYDMKGNVAEWTSTPREEIMNAEVKPEN